MVRIDGDWEAFWEYVESGKAQQEWDESHQKALKHIEKTFLSHLSPEPEIHPLREELSDEPPQDRLCRTLSRIRVWL